MSEKNIKNIAYLYIIIPITIYILGWCKIIISIPITIALAFVYYLLYKQTRENNTEQFISKKGIAILFIIITTICIFGGHGGFYYQSSDWDARNAIFRDLINMDWPVYYSSKNTALDYYIGQWMVPAVIGKVFAFISSDVAWTIGNISMLIYNSIGITIAVLLVIDKLKLKTVKSQILCTIIFLFFSGLDIIGMFVTNNVRVLTRDIHLEWWPYYYQYSSMITQIFWVFNQCIVPWIVTILIFDEKNVKNYMFLVVAALPFGPLPFVGISIIFIFKGLFICIDYVKNKKTIDFIKEVFSVQNILSFVCVLPIFLLYYLANSSTSNSTDGGGFGIYSKALSEYGIVFFIIFYIFEVGIYGIILWKKHKKDKLYYVIFGTLMIIPFFKLGYAADFCMRVSIPALVIIDYWIIEFLLECYESKNKRVMIVIISVLCIGVITPITEFSRGIYVTIESGKIINTCDDTKTFSDKEEIYENFEAVNPKENSIFFKYIARK